MLKVGHGCYASRCRALPSDVRVRRRQLEGARGRGLTPFAFLPGAPCAFRIRLTMPIAFVPCTPVSGYPFTRLSQTRMLPSREAVERMSAGDWEGQPASRRKVTANQTNAGCAGPKRCS